MLRKVQTSNRDEAIAGHKTAIIDNDEKMIFMCQIRAFMKGTFVSFRSEDLEIKDISFFN